MIRYAYLVLAALLATAPAWRQSPGLRRVHVFVTLADNQHYCQLALPNSVNSSTFIDSPRLQP